ncbi:DNA repair protein rad50 [Cichlidogyrus casuarinus]|uniref:DNA repair protein rad50 n=1 Tax=Cichlidogyrus casuarinus TaxID=1844966 RepID=A0ABD2QBD1_9PLAT
MTEQLKDQAGTCDLDQVLQFLRMDKTKIENSFVAEKGSIHLWRQFYEKLKTDETSGCPVCHRCFDSAADQKVILGEIDAHIKNAPERLKEMQNTLDVMSQKYENVLQLKPLQKQIEELQTVQIPNTKKIVEKRQSEIDEYGLQLDTKMKNLDLNKSEEQLARSMQTDLAVMDQLVKQIRKLEIDLQKVETNSEDGLFEEADVDSHALTRMEEKRDDLRSEK